ncbi:sensor histidine kinase [Paenibacillus sinopodophylli]|uniref:sensor histidine kinase n=1 Tax=Paenibacillus sinopodophylli TaxID=1837342 RepID=UPI001485E270|nr:ATP-binding protein [Paenibacillus sinopodophylli]
MGILRKVQKFKVSLSALLIFMFLFLITNIAYLLLTKDALISEANKRLDVQAEYVRQHIGQIKESDSIIQRVENSYMTGVMRMIETKLGARFLRINEEILVEIVNEFKLDSIAVNTRNFGERKLVNIASESPKDLRLDEGLTVIHDINGLTHFYYQSNANDYVIQIDSKSNIPADISKRVSEHIAQLHNNPVNLYHDKPLTLEFILTETTNNHFNGIQNMVTDGSYKLANKNDIDYVKKVTHSGEKNFYIEEINGKKYEKYFMPLAFENESYVLFLISDYSLLERVLYDQVIKYVYAIILSSALFLILCFIVYRVFLYRREQVLHTIESSYRGSLDSLFQSLRWQRHDFNNHMTTVHALVSMKEYDDLITYTSTLVEEATSINEILNINCPPIMGLIQAKVAYAATKKIDFTFDILDFRDINIKHIKENEIVSVLGNLIDNAFEAVLENMNAEPSKVKVSGIAEGQTLKFKVFNNGPEISAALKQKIFEPGFTTKKTGTGLGLQIIGQLTKKYDGKLTLDYSNDDGTQFTAEFSL